MSCAQYRTHPNAESQVPDDPQNSVAMPSRLNQIAHLFVAVHMALGCAWHHGALHSGCCHLSTGLSGVSTDPDPCGGKHRKCQRGCESLAVVDGGYEQDAVTDNFNVGMPSQGDNGPTGLQPDAPYHGGCHADHCSLQPLVRFDVHDLLVKSLLDIAAPDFSFAKELVALAVTIAEPPIGSSGAAGVRAHLFHCVLLI